MKIFKPSREQLLGLASRVSGFSEDVIDFYCQHNNIEPGNLTLRDSVYLTDKLNIIDRYLKIKKLRDKI